MPTRCSGMCLSYRTTILLLLIYCLMYFPLFVGVLCLSIFCYALLCAHSRCNHLEEDETAGYFTIIVLQMYCNYKCSLALPHCAVGWSALCDCGIY